MLNRSHIFAHDALLCICLKFILNDTVIRSVNDFPGELARDVASSKSIYYSVIELNDFACGVK